MRDQAIAQLHFFCEVRRLNLNCGTSRFTSRFLNDINVYMLASLEYALFMYKFVSFYMKNAISQRKNVY